MIFMLEIAAQPFKAMIKIIPQHINMISMIKITPAVSCNTAPAGKLPWRPEKKAAHAPREKIGLCHCPAFLQGGPRRFLGEAHR
jgi:hypothetical protein